MSYTKCSKGNTEIAAKKALARLNTRRQKRREKVEGEIEKKIENAMGKRLWVLWKVKTREQAIRWLNSRYMSFEENLDDAVKGEMTLNERWKENLKLNACNEVISLCEKTSEDFIYLSGEHARVLDIKT